MEIARGGGGRRSIEAEAGEWEQDEKDVAQVDKRAMEIARESYDATSLPSTPAAERGRRVILRNLPPNAKLPQIARGVQTHGQILSITPLATLPFTNDTTKTVMVEFLHPKPAAELVRTIQASPLVYEDENSDEYQPDAWLVPTASLGLSWVDQEVVSQNYSRSLMLKGFPSD
ncbi:hypothetical protein ACHAPV_004741 [Trichoderma viride]